MKSNNIFFHPKLKEYCIITRKYSDNSWYFKKINDPSKEYKALMKISELPKEVDIIKENDVVKLNYSELISGRLERTFYFKNYTKENRENTFVVKNVDGEVISLENCPFTFWIGHLIKVS